MKTTMIFYGAAALFLITQGCRKNQSSTSVNNQSVAPPKVVENSSLIAYGTFLFTNVSSNKVLEIRSDSALMTAQSKPANVQQNANNNTGIGMAANQKWYLIQQGAGSITANTPFKIMNVESGMYLEAPNSASGTQLFDDHANNSATQIWYIHQVSGQTYYYIANSNGLVIADHANSTVNGAPVTEETLANTINQYWNLGSIANEAYRDDAVVTFFHRGATANTTVAFDQGNSIPLTFESNSGKVLWITEDAYASSQLQSNGYLYCQFFSYHNSGLLQPTITNWSSGSTPNITTTSNANTGISELEIIKSPGAHNSTYTWPGVGVEIGNIIYLYAYESANGLTPPNQVLYEIPETSGSTAWGSATRLTPAGMSGQTKIGYSVGMIKNLTNDTVYVYGAESTFFNANAIFLARFPTTNPTLWSYWRGNGWASTPDTSSALLGQLRVGNGTSTQANVAVSYINGKYVMMQMDLGYFCDPSSHSIYISTSSSPSGPFTVPTMVYTINDMYNGHIAKYYTPSIHTEFVNGKNELLVTYCLNYNASGGSCTTQTCFNNNQDPNFYQIKGVRIPYSLIGL